MNPERYKQVKQVFGAACRLDAAERAAYLDQVCAGDIELRAEVEALLAHDEKTLPILPFVPAAAMLDSDLQPLVESDLGERSRDPQTSSSRMGRFRILRKIGEGGMGVVYEAEQDNPRRTVALKVIRPGVASQQTLLRFDIEAQILGRLQHPGIAQIYEAGTAAIETSAGLTADQPYFAMEFVHGKPLDQAILRPDIGTRARLEVFAKICDAVHHAHQKGVIHRDLKPGNILVDESGQPKILDFGVARLTDSDLQVTTQRTNVGQIIGTITYMSPEQIAGDSHELDTRSDVYALGVLCYQLLTGRLPHDLRGKAIPEAARAVIEDAPARLSTINRRLRGDLETIVTKAMEKEKDRRYQSAMDLGEDIRRYLSDQPIAARPPTTVYHLRKFAQRNKPLVVGVIAAFAALIIGIIGTTSQAVRATRARDRALKAEQLADQRREEAEHQTRIAQAVISFLNTDLLASAKPEAQGRDVTVRQVLDKASDAIKGKFADEPLVEATIRLTLGDTYMSLGLYELAQPHLEQALALRQRGLGEDHVDTLKALMVLGYLYIRQGRHDEAEPVFLRCLEQYRGKFGEDNPETLAAMEVLGVLYKRQGRYADAEPIYVDVLNARRRLLGEENKETIVTMTNLAILYRVQDRLDKAEPLYIKAQELSERALGEDHPYTLNLLNGLAVMYKNQRRFKEAERLYLKVVDARRRLLGAEHPDTLESMHNLAIFYAESGEEYEKVEPVFQELLQIRHRVLGAAHPRTLAVMHDWGCIATRGQRYEQAEPLLVQALEGRRRVLGEEHQDTVDSIAVLGGLYAREGRHAEAEPLHREALQKRRNSLGDDDRHTLTTLKELVVTLIAEGKFEEAQPLALECYERRETTAGRADGKTREAVEVLSELYTQWGKPESAAAWRAKLTEMNAASRPASSRPSP